MIHANLRDTSKAKVATGCFDDTMSAKRTRTDEINMTDEGLVETCKNAVVLNLTSINVDRGEQYMKWIAVDEESSRISGDRLAWFKHPDMSNGEDPFRPNSDDEGYEEYDRSGEIDKFFKEIEESTDCLHRGTGHEFVTPRGSRAVRTIVHYRYHQFDY